MPTEPFDAGDRVGTYLLPRVESYGGFGCAVTFGLVKGSRKEAAHAHTLCLKNGPPSEIELLAPVYVGDVYQSADPQFAVKALHEFILICCEQEF